MYGGCSNVFGCLCFTLTSQPNAFREYDAKSWLMVPGIVGHTQGCAPTELSVFNLLRLRLIGRVQEAACKLHDIP